jgi:predicted NUDIX family NTP pyrophosphohydrolase
VAARSAGILLWRTSDVGVEVLLGHLGGPLWSRKDAGAWSAPKGEYDDTEAPLQAALREFTEETGLAVPVDSEELVPLGEVRQPSGKRVSLWAGRGDLDPDAAVPGTFTMEWPPRSGRMAEFPELDRFAWWSVGDARDRLVAGQRPFLDRLLALIDASAGSTRPDE